MGIFRCLGKRKIAKASFITLVAAAALAAAVFVANNQPYGYIAPPALSTTNLSKGNGVAYTPWFETGSFRGDLLALPVGGNGTVTLLAPNWRASDQVDVQDWDTDRRIVTTDGAGTAMPFRFDDLTPAQQGQVGSADIVNFVRGNRAKEGAGYRVRSSVLGDIIHSGPAYVGKPKSGYVFDDYLAFANANAYRAPRVYVGANDGMLHAYDAVSGREAFAYVPSMVMSNLSRLAADPYNHQYFVDGFITAEDAQFGASWHTVLVGGLGAGGKGYYGLDVTGASAVTEAGAAGKVLWEFNAASAGAANLGYSYSRPSIIRVASGDWVAAVGNGYLSGSGVASLYLLDIQTGAIVREIVVPDMNANGLSSPTVIDRDGDGYADIAYAGDLNGNLWKFDVNAGTVKFGGQPLFRTEVTGGSPQPITTAPDIGHHPEDGVFVYFATGRLLSATDSTNSAAQAVYGIWDDDSGPVPLASLVRQQLTFKSHANGAAVRVASALRPDWAVHRGWVTSTEIVGATVSDQGERVIQDILLRDGRITYMGVNPTVASGDNWLMQLDALTGGAPEKTIIDIDANNLLNVADNVDGNGDGVIADAREDRVVGQYQNFGLASRPIAGTIGFSKDTALINHLAAISPAAPNVVAGDPLDPGLVGGHFDLDTSHVLYPFGGGDTDGHVHQWDDKHNATTVNFFNLPDGNGNPLYEIDGHKKPANAPFAVESDELFLLTIANTALSPGGVLEINSTSINVEDYHGLMNRYLAGTLAPGESFPVYKLDKPTDAQKAAGVEQLKTLKLSFDAYAIISGDIIPSETGCVRGNDMGREGEYRNGALMIQAVNASNVGGGFVFNPMTNRYEAPSAALDATHGHATAGLHWESSVFWHWSDGCYDSDDWLPAYTACIINGLGGCTEGTAADGDTGKKKGKKDKGKKGDPPPPGSPPEPPPVGVGDTDHSVTNTTVSGADDLGRLFWKELIPEE